MTSKSKSLPFLVLAIVALSLLAEVYYEIEIDLNQIMPVLIAVGVAGAAKKAVEKAAEARKAIPKNIEELIKKEIEKVLPK